MKTISIWAIATILLLSLLVVVAQQSKKNTTKYQKLYNEHCFVCHQAGGAGSPKLGDAVAWNPRIQQGKQAMVKHTFDGMNFMPAKGNCDACSKADLEEIIVYMMQQCPDCEPLK